MVATPSKRRFAASMLFVWLFALAVSTRVIYPEPVQMAFLALMLAYAWAAPSLRLSVLASMKKFFARSEGKILLLLLLSSTITTVLVSLRQKISLDISLWLDWLLIVLFAGGLFGCTALLGQPSDTLRRAFRLVAVCLLAAMLLWVCMLLILATKGKLVPYLANASLYWSYSQAGMFVVFFPLLFAAFSGKGMVAPQKSSEKTTEKIIWRCCVSVALLLVFCAAVISERRIFGVALIASLLVLMLALVPVFVPILGHKFRSRLSLPSTRLFLLGLSLLVLGISLFVAALLLHLYHNPVIYKVKSGVCDTCNSLYLPVWLVDSVRQAAWHETLIVWKENPWWGRGIHNDLSSFFHPHNRYLQVLSGLGIAGFGLFVSLLVLVFVNASLRWYRTGSLSALCLMFVHGVYWATGLFELSIWSVWHVGMYGCAIVMSLCLDRLAEEGD